MFFQETYFQAKILQIMHEEMEYTSSIKSKDITTFKAIAKAVQKARGTPYEAALQIRMSSLRNDLEAPYPLKSGVLMMAELIYMSIDPVRCKHQISIKFALEDLEYIRQQCSEASSSGPAA